MLFTLQEAEAKEALQHSWNDFIMVLYVVFKWRQQHFSFLCRENKKQMIFEASGNNYIKILDILFSEKLQINISVSMKPTLKTICKVHAPDY